MHGRFIALAAAMGLALALAGCQGATLQNPYAAIGPVTVPPPGMQTAAAGYYTPPPAMPTNSATNVPVIDIPAGTARPSLVAPIRTEITAQPQAGSATPSFSTGGADSAAEPPIRIVEAAPASRPSPIKAASQPATTFPIREPTTPGVVTAAPAVPFNPSSAPAKLSQLPRPPALAPVNAVPAGGSPALQRTRGFGTGTQPAAPASSTPASSTPKNRLSTAPGFLSDPHVAPATFVETTTAAAGQWKTR
jgi:hypothetical protein